jgi:hypothetical protein
LLRPLALVALSVPPILRTEQAVGMDATLGADHPVVRQFDAFLERFGGGYPILVAYECGAARDCAGALSRSRSRWRTRLRAASSSRPPSA